MKYRSIHNWVVYHFSKANKCEICGLDKEREDGKRTFCWSNKDHKYKKDIKDWQQVCYPCHRKYDYEKFPELAKRKFPAWKKRKRIKVCKLCGIKFNANRKERIYCGKSCAMKVNSSKPRPNRKKSLKHSCRAYYIFNN